MNCNVSERDLALYIGGDVSGTERSRLDRHVPDCGTCQSRVADLEAALSELETLRGDTVDPEHLRTLRGRIRGELAALPDPGWRVKLERMLLARFRPPALTAGAFGAILLLMLGLWLVRSDPDAVGVSSRVNREPAVPATTERPQRPDPEHVPSAEPPQTAPIAPSGGAVALSDTRPEVPGEGRQVLIKLLTTNPDIVVYWLVEDDGRPDQTEGGV